MDMVERVARALAASDEANPPIACACSGKEPKDFACPCAMFTARRRARAAIEAMREPDHDMTANVLRPGEDRTFLVELWQRMIDGALAKPATIAAISPTGEK